ncbi:ABC transporter ATP-binding protein [Streptomyces sp. CA-249302]|uniref:ABC transporter ATP-binding protein n=1 Tax=Streptomyces sp. CA-249302 TaxID=3240058 RepID=UPI003D8B133B
MSASAAVTPVPLLDVFGLTKRYPTRQGEITACEDVSFRVARGGALALVGESGAGKSTVIRLVAGLEEPSAGRVVLGGNGDGDSDGRRLRGRAARLARAATVQIVHQDPYSSLDPRQPIGDGLAELLRLHAHRLPGDLTDRSARRARAAELLETVGLPGLAHARPARLSGGQRQRAAIARALALEPDVLLLDEAVAALDVSVQAQILNLLADLRERTGTTLLFVTHDLAVVRQLCEEAVVMHRGRIVEQGPVARIFTDPQHPYTRTLLASIPRPGWRPHRIRREVRTGG